MVSRMSEPVVIIGAGLAGLSCARELKSAGVPSIIYEASDDVGGRVRTDHFDGFRLDRGFQVFLTAYPEAARQLDYAQLDLAKFEAGSLIRTNNKLHRLTDPWRKPARIIETAVSPPGRLKDKLLIGLLRWRSNRQSLEDIFSGPDIPTERELDRLGFSNQMIEQFLRPFLGGVFLDDQLITSSRMMYFVFRMFSRGDTTLPALGMHEIPRQLAGDLPEDSIRLGSPVEAIDERIVTLSSKSRVPYSRLVIATEQNAASKLIPELGGPKSSRFVTCLYFSAPEPPIEDRMLVLNGTSSGLVNNVCVPSQISSHYGTDGKALISITVLKDCPDKDSLPAAVKQELQSWFGSSVDGWNHLRTYHIPNALPDHSPSLLVPTQSISGLPKNCFICGDHQTNGSINGALASGRNAADSVLNSL